MTEIKDEEKTVKGWRLDLVRNCLMWKGSGYLHAKYELMALIAKCSIIKTPLQVLIYTDSYTFEKFYLKWLNEEGLEGKLNDAISFRLLEYFQNDSIIDFEINSEIFQYINLEEERKEYLSKWLSSTREAIDDEHEKYDNLYLDRYPDWLDRHLQSQDDEIVAMDVKINEDWRDKIRAVIRKKAAEMPQTETTKQMIENLKKEGKSLTDY